MEWSEEKILEFFDEWLANASEDTMDEMLSGIETAFFAGFHKALQETEKHGVE
jgi:hypothetical protein